jgi:hypothetical protein
LALYQVFTLNQLQNPKQKKRAEQLAKALKVHPAIIMFPEYEAEAIRKVA